MYDDPAPHFKKTRYRVVVYLHAFGGRHDYAGRGHTIDGIGAVHCGMETFVGDYPPPVSFGLDAGIYPLSTIS